MAALLRTTDATVRAARLVLEDERRRLRDAAVPGELLLTGGSSLPGLVTKGDIDLHLRVDGADFASAVERLRRVLRPARPEIWTAWFAAFERDGAPPLGIAVTVVGSEHDRRFIDGWAVLAADPEARREYNALKTGDDVEAAKGRFFSRIAG